MKMDRKYWLHRVIVCFLMMIIIIQIPMHAYADEKKNVKEKNAEKKEIVRLNNKESLSGQECFR